MKKIKIRSKVLLNHFCIAMLALNFSMGFRVLRDVEIENLIFWLTFVAWGGLITRAIAIFVKNRKARLSRKALRKLKQISIYVLNFYIVLTFCIIGKDTILPIVKLITLFLIPVAIGFIIGLNMTPTVKAEIINEG